MVQAHVEWTEEALEHLLAIRRYIGQFDPEAAGGLAARIFSAGESLADFPNKSREGRHGTRELPTIRPYILIYRVHEGRVVILRIRHGRQRPPED